MPTLGKAKTSTLLCLALYAQAISGATTTNLTSLVNLFIGTASGANGGSGGNAFPGAAIPHAMAKVHLLREHHSLTPC